MLSHVTFGSNDLPKAKGFYEALFGTIGFSKIFDHPSGGAIYGKDGKPQIGILGPHDGKAASVGNGAMAAFYLPDAAGVDAIHAKALRLGGSCDGPPGPRGDSGYYGAYVRDLDGNKIAFYTMKAA
jgi:catechol 2,3-dioxygenase-like lactoylglutathione lyase family enzyme